ncbi:hypothetical protein [Granulicella sp. S156]|uniref:hypothetical protein n=1 Tax=Granulicella sp. S156 TaxID=1747224 RepID=UPI00131EC6C1|nr:hypothetical protein [Granulicella sp. S156]
MPSLRTFSTPRLALALPASFCLAAVLSGCGSGVVTTSSTGTLGIQGIVRGGQQPVSSASIFLYSAGKTGNGSAATSMLNNPVTTDSTGSFTIAGDYACSSSTDQVYLVATGGNPGLGGSISNAAIVMMTALGNCGNLSTTPFVTINEVTTAAAAWALAPFMTSYANVGASATNTLGITNAFLDAQLLASSSKGTAATLAANLITESSKLYTLADAIATCVNSDGGSSCTPLFTAATPSGVTAPTDTLGALLNIVKHPGQNVAAIYTVVQSTPPFSPTLSKAPNDWTMSLTIQGGALNPSSGIINMSDPNYALAGGLYYPERIDIDANGYVWVGNNGSGTNSGDSSVSEFTPQGEAISPKIGYGYTGLNELFALVIDSTGNIWVTNQQGNNVNNNNNADGSITGFLGSNSATPGSPITNTNPATGGYGSLYFFDASTVSGTYFPSYLSANNSGQIFVGNQDADYASVFTTSTGAISALGIGDTSFPQAIAADSSGGVWLGNSDPDTTISHVAADGTSFRPTCCSGPYALATDSSGNVWAENYDNNTISEVSPTGAVLVNQLAISGVQPSNGLSIDAGQNLWIANYHSATTTVGASFTGISTSSLTALSPAPSGCTTTSGDTTCTTPGGFGVDAGMVSPVATIPDRSGNVWITSKDTNGVVMFIGLAVPTATPMMPTPTAP